MTILTVRLPDDTAQRQKCWRKAVVSLLTSHLRAMVATGDMNKALGMLDRLDVQDAASNKH